ncbi:MULTISPECIES: signal peptidase I [Caproicibacterium]|uniref:Signal peptidase I n=1 Tax=Caproicibacterium argilliputei TaxID=3030016 RepID=A0AA97D8D8_9FIRM|nr:signal peptidase I [Caproicibacterium argilliputei]WOC31557.1 signal peptidase I [Caproicibacterium argilliputei]
MQEKSGREDAEQADRQEGNRRTEKKENPRTWILSVLITIAATLLFCNFVARPSRVIGVSMQNTCHDGDLVLLWELQYHPQRGDIVVVNSDNPLQENLIKRVIAVAGDHIVVSNGTVTRNGKKLTEPYVKEQPWSGTDVDLTVPPDHVFLMGDNRNHSTDSREIGAVAASDVIGKVVVRLYPFTTIRTF